MLRSVFVMLALSAMQVVFAQTCDNLCLQQTTCANPATDTMISGTVYMPNGTVPLPNALVYVPNAAVQPFTPGVGCKTCTTPSGSPLVAAVTDASGRFLLHNAPVGPNIPLVIQVGRWRRQILVPSVSACATTLVAAPLTKLPPTHSVGDIPLIGFVTGSADTEECLLRKIGLLDSEFGNAGGAARINLFQGAVSPGAKIDASTLSEDTLENSAATLNKYDAVIMGCQGSSYIPVTAAQDNFVAFVNAGGRALLFHKANSFLVNDAAYTSLATWIAGGGSTNPPNQTGYIDTSSLKASTLAEWLTLMSPTTMLGQVPLTQLRQDYTTVSDPAINWVNLQDATLGTVPVQFSFNQPTAAAPGARCGRVAFVDYHSNVGNTGTSTFPAECVTGAMTPQELAAAYTLFDTTNCVQADTFPTLSATRLAGNRQAVTPGQVYSTLLRVQLTNADGTHPQGYPVTFTAVASSQGANGSFSSAIDQVTSYDGVAIAPFLTSNTTVGTFTVTTNVGATFTLYVGDDVIFSDNFE
jgi:hypothetical protein